MGLGTRETQLGAMGSHHIEPCQEGPDSTFRPLGTRKDERRGSWMEFELPGLSQGKSQKATHKGHTKVSRARPQRWKCPGKTGAGRQALKGAGVQGTERWRECLK